VPSICQKRDSSVFARSAKSAAHYLATLILGTAALVAARAQERVPGLTGIDRAGDVVQARQLLMSGIEEEMQAIDVVAGGKDLPLDDLKANAYRINIMLAAFPHLFPPQTKPSTGPDALSTAAAPEIWQSFDDFYGQVEVAAAVAYEASQVSEIGPFRERAVKLRAACDGCHGKYMKVETPPRP
jgi:cytochrome c556